MQIDGKNQVQDSKKWLERTFFPLKPALMSMRYFQAKPKKKVHFFKTEKVDGIETAQSNQMNLF